MKPPQPLPETSLRSPRGSRTAPHATRVADTRILQAVREEVLAVGVGRATASSIARRAKVARVTVYRHGWSIDSLVLQAITDEAVTLAADVTDHLPDGDGLHVLTEMCCRTVNTIASSELLPAVLRHDSELLLPYLTERLGASQRIFVDTTIPLLEAGHRDGTIRRDDPRVQATILLQILTPFALGPALLTREIGADTTHEQVRRLVIGYLANTDQAEPPPGGNAE
ncbi:hypothetical protein KEM60_01684 [Austwickia sp. TVS 96-490-7B]|uniref:TetR/AcrR family transcriptional regulator n=1 Tax=Austwickia sp. TVS 96-490-7B TaxID=2830843 RepID=UPI001C55A6E6|nr:TetR/AcrR family transcriptional regulator [Austwickia sp. TVS 96-490-7B]MBW3085484.1 hypothetical protein [Austwickia sp. TVS 96-490-7B]